MSLSAIQDDGGMPYEHRLQYVQQCRKDWAEILPANLMDKLDSKRQQVGKSTLKGDDNIKEKIKHLEPYLRKVIAKCGEVFGYLPPPASFKKLVEIDLHRNTKFEGQ